MSSIGGLGGGNVGDARTMILWELKDILDDISRHAQEGVEDSSWGSYIERMRDESLSYDFDLAQELQKMSEYLGDMIRHLSRSGNYLPFEHRNSSRDESTTREQGAEVELIQAAAPISILISPSNEPGEPSATSAISITVTPEASENCTICFEVITTLCILQPCEHKFDMDCIMPWLISVYSNDRDERALRCPLCRQGIDTIRHSIVGDGMANMMIVGPHFRQQFRGQGQERPWDDLMRAASVVPVYRPAIPHLSDVGGAIAYQPSRGNTIDEVHLTQRGEHQPEAQRARLYLQRRREDELPDLFSQEDIIDFIDWRDTMNAARASVLEDMGEGAPKGLYVNRRGHSRLEGLREEYSCVECTSRQPGSASSTRPVIPHPSSPVSRPERGEFSQRAQPATRRPSTGHSTEAPLRGNTGRVGNANITLPVRARSDGLREPYDAEVVRQRRLSIMGHLRESQS
ncbi:hypothetical protein DL95DRAFT_460202 [Leptodontidium sp. 2 PMI_412]|nr:hypothetical protein DL95DRAFT_460202 [Leptodontidium sp. 2 PMI_412]